MNKIIKIIIPLIVIFITGCTITGNNKPQNIKQDTIKEEIQDIDKDLKYDLPLGIDSVKLMKSGKLIIVPNNKALAENEQVVAENVNKVYLFTFGNGGYRTIIFIKNDKTVSSINASSLIENKKIVIDNNLGNLTDVESIKQDDDFLIYAVLSNKEEKMLDGYIK